MVGDHSHVSSCPGKRNAGFKLTIRTSSQRDDADVVRLAEIDGPVGGCVARLFHSMAPLVAASEASAAQVGGCLPGPWPRSRTRRGEQSAGPAELAKAMP